jgi:hypothetical protein
MKRLVRFICCLVLWAPMCLAAPRVSTFENAPVCQGVSMSVVLLDARQADYRFRLTVQNDSSKAVVLAPLLPSAWKLEGYGLHGWRPAGGGGLGPGWAVNSNEHYPNQQYIHVAPAGSFTKAFDQVDLFGDGGGPVPQTAYRVIFTYWYQPSAGETSLGLLPCAIHASPVQFIGRPDR